MQEFMLLIRNTADHQAAWTVAQHRQFLEQCRLYITRLRETGRLKAAQPLVREGVMLSGTPGAWHEGPFPETEEVIVGYYHILATDLRDALAVARDNPEFVFGATARVEIRPVKTREPDAGFTYAAPAA